MGLTHFAGIDVSKNTLDISIVTEGILITHIRVANNAKAINIAVPKILKDLGVTIDNTVFCMEDTGIYNKPFLTWLQKQQAKIWMESAFHISRSQGAIRGKNDKIDSARIAMFAYTYRHKIRFWTAPSLAIEKVSALLSQRNRLIKAKVQIKNTLKEQKTFFQASINKLLGKYTAGPLQSLEQEIKSIEKGILNIIKRDHDLNRLYSIIVSVDGVGFVTATNIIVTTKAFQAIKEGKKYACYAGVVPFQYSSGTSLQSRSKVSHRANKTLKVLLHISAISSIRMKGELQDYYKRKIAEGKNKMSVLNAIRNKIVLRIFACVKRNGFYEKTRPYVMPNKQK